MTSKKQKLQARPEESNGRISTNQIANYMKAIRESIYVRKICSVLSGF